MFQQTRNVELPKLKYKIIDDQKIETDPVKVPLSNYFEVRKGFFKEFSRWGNKAYESDDELILYNPITVDCYKISWRHGSTDLTGEKGQYFSLTFISYAKKLEPLVERLKQLGATETVDEKK